MIILKQFSEILKKGINIFVGPAVLDYWSNMQNIVLINNSQTPRSTEILKPSLSFSNNLLQAAYIIFQKRV